MSEMVERVADGLANRFQTIVALTAGTTFEETDVVMPHRDIWRSYARAAIEAIRNHLKESGIDTGSALNAMTTALTPADGNST